MSEVGVEIVKTEETEKNRIKYLNINVSNSEVERNPDVVRICADAGILEYVKLSGDAISRHAVLNEFYDVENLYERIKQLPPVNPQESKIGHCKDCRWWKDSDGVYRRGIGAESQCPMNRIEVYEGNGYCYKFEPKESEEV